MKSQILGISQENPDCEIIEHINNHQFKYFLDRINDIEVMNDFEQKYYTNYLNNYLLEDIWNHTPAEIHQNILDNFNDTNITLILKYIPDNFWDKFINFINISKEWSLVSDIFSNESILRKKILNIIKENLELDDLKNNLFGYIIISETPDTSRKFFEKFLKDINLRQLTINYFSKIVNKSIIFKNIISIIDRHNHEDDIFINKLLELLLNFWNIGTKNKKLEITDEPIYSSFCILNWVDNTDDRVYKFIPQLFYIINKLLETTITRYIDEIGYRVKEKKIINSEIEKLQENSSGLGFLIYNKIQYFQDILDKTNTVITNITEYLSYFKSRIKIFYDFTLEWLCNLEPKNINTFDNVIHNILEYTKYYNVILSINDYKKFSYLLGNNKVTNNQHIKSDIISIYFNDIRDIIQILRNDQYLSQDILNNLLDCMVLINDNSGDDELYDKITPYFKIMNITKIILNLSINNYLGNSTFNTSYEFMLNNYSSNKLEHMKKIININVNSLNNSIQEMFTNISMLYKIENDLIESDKNIDDLKSKIKSFISMTMEYLESNIILSHTFETEYTSLELKNTFSNLINVLLTNMVGENKKYLNINDKDQYLFNPKLILQLVHKLISPFLENDIFIDSLLYEQYNTGKMINKMKGILVKINKISYLEAYKLNTLSEKLNSKYNKNLELEDIEIPDEFCDPILDTLIIDPVYLPNTDIIMDKEVIARHLITDQHNPFNREELTLEILEKYNQQEEIKKSVDIFKEKILKWKNDNNYNS
jgi:hypothetical protein